MSPDAGPDARKLTQEEMDALLAAAGQGEAGERHDHARRVHTYDFTQPSRFNRSQQEEVRKISEGFAQRAAENLSRLLRTAVKLQLAGMDHLKWENLVNESGEETVAFLLDLKPLGRRGLVVFQRPLVAACLERMTGGQAAPGQVDATLTALDLRIFGSFVRALLKPLPKAWERLGPFEVAPGPAVQDMQSLDLFSNTEDMFQLNFLMQGAAGAGPVALVVPFEAVRNLPPKSDEEGEETVADTRETAEQRLRASLNETPVELTVLLGAADLKVERLVRARPGDVIVLDKPITRPLDIRVNDRVKLRGYPGVSSGKLAVRVVSQAGVAASAGFKE